MGCGASSKKQGPAVTITSAGNEAAAKPVIGTTAAAVAQGGPAKTSSGLDADAALAVVEGLVRASSATAEQNPVAAAGLAMSAAAVAMEMKALRSDVSADPAVAEGLAAAAKAAADAGSLAAPGLVSAAAASALAAAQARHPSRAQENSAAKK
mmetsp:Transcript_31375/g.73201  ORF Transcript_31375/g.73201 Transcript_31375/m.73201 type:complete len:153 (-) Transcript_31375:169-627(-)